MPTSNLMPSSDGPPPGVPLSQLFPQVAAAAAAPALPQVPQVDPSALIQQLQQAQQMQLTRQARRIYVGNLPIGIGLTDAQVTEFFNTAMMAAGLAQGGTPPVISTWLSSEGKFGFVEFRSPEEATSALMLDGCNFMGRTLRLGRPKDYMPIDSAGGSTAALGMPLGFGLGMASSATSANALPLGIRQPIAAPTPTTVLVLLNMVTKEEVMNDEDYLDIVDDVRDECSKFGSVVDLVIPRPVDGVDSPGQGKAFVKFTQPSEAQKAYDALSGRRFSNRTVIASYLEESKFDNRQFD